MGQKTSLLKKIKAFFYSEKGNFVVSVLMLAAFLKRSTILMIITCLVWLLYLRYLQANAKDESVRIVNYLMAAVAVIIMVIALYLLVVMHVF